MPERVLTLEAALAVVAEHAAHLAPPTGTESLPLHQSLHRVLAEPVLATRDQPPFDRSTRDGFALRAADANTPLRILGQIRAGERWTGSALQPGEAIEIMTGAPLPAGADAVLMVEHATITDQSLTTSRILGPGENVVPRATEAHAGDMLIAAGQHIDAATIAAAAGNGQSTLTVYTRPQVAILATGDELLNLDSDTAPEDWQIYNSNTPALAALVAAAGGEPQSLPIARDTMDDLRARLDAAQTADFLLLSGGVSMGKFDLVEQALAERGAEFLFTGALIQPGKPIVFGRLPRKHSEWLYFFGLPGNPVSTEVCFHLFAATILRALTGSTDIAPHFVAATVSEPFSGKPNLIRLLPAYLESTYREATVHPVAWQGSGDTTANARANCYCVVEEHGLAIGNTARILLR